MKQTSYNKLQSCSKKPQELKENPNVAADFKRDRGQVVKHHLFVSVLWFETKQRLFNLATWFAAQILHSSSCCKGTNLHSRTTHEDASVNGRPCWSSTCVWSIVVWSRRHGFVGSLSDMHIRLPVMSAVNLHSKVKLVVSDQFRITHGVVNKLIHYTEHWVLLYRNSTAKDTEQL